MRRWLDRIGAAASHVADRSTLWLPGALAWMVTFGWVALLVGVARAPSVAELTFFGAAVVTSGAWPWNGDRARWPPAGCWSRLHRAAHRSRRPRC